MTDEEWMIDLAERLEGEAEKAARDAAKQAKKAKGEEKRELIADREGLSSIAFKAAQFVRDAKRAKKPAHSTKKTSKMSPAQLDREIAEVLGTRPINKRKRVRHFSEWKDKKGGQHYAVTYEDRSGHTITREELDLYRGREARI